MKRKGFEQSIERIYATGDDEVDCDSLQALLPAYVEVEIAGADPAKRFPAVYSHLVQCPDCAEEHMGLIQVARLEARGKLLSAEELLAQFEAEPAPEENETPTAFTQRHNC